MRFNGTLLTKTEFGISSTTQANTQDDIDMAISKVERAITQDTYGFLSILEKSYTQHMLHEVQQAYDQIRWAKTMVVVGIGGSDLGARALQEALQPDVPPMEVMFHGDSTDPEQMRQLDANIDLSRTLFVIISKSGTTVETMSQYLYWKERLQRFVKESNQHDSKSWGDHFVFVTDPSKGLLRAEAQKHDITTVSIPENVGGRFSVLTPVGLLPAMAMGISVVDLMKGAREWATSQEKRNKAYEFAASQFQLLTQGIRITVAMSYAVRLQSFTAWFRQLWAESLGKNGTGILPVQAKGPADQHSQVQFYAQGAPIMSLLFIQIAHSEHDYFVPDTDISELSYLSGKSFNQICKAQQVATAQALHQAGRPSALLEIEELSAYTIGSAIVFFELAVVVVAELLKVNAFDQPGVEQGKKITNELLGNV